MARVRFWSPGLSSFDGRWMGRQTTTTEQKTSKKTTKTTTHRIADDANFFRRLSTKNVELKFSVQFEFLRCLAIFKKFQTNKIFVFGKKRKKKNYNLNPELKEVAWSLFLHLETIVWTTFFFKIGAFLRIFQLLLVFVSISKLWSNSLFF